MPSPTYSLAKLALAQLALAAAPLAFAQFMDDFDAPRIAGWEANTGDGQAEARILPDEGFARIEIDATNDPHNVWWAIIKRDVADYLDLQKLADPAYELRVEMRVRPSHAPRRVNIMINTQRTTDFHKQLREYDLPEAGEWHTISMTTRDLDVVPGDELNVQLGITDWGSENYRVDIDYYLAEIVRAKTAERDLGEPLVYHPPVPPLESFQTRLPVAHDAIVHPSFPQVSFHRWRSGDARVLTVSDAHTPVLRWDFSRFPDAKAASAGVLELTTRSVALGGDYVAAYGEDLGIEFNKIRVFEILDGPDDWSQSTVTFQTIAPNGDLGAVLNSQMTFDAELNAEPDGKTYLTLPRPVMQRLLDGETRGLALRPLGAIVADLYDSEDERPDVAPTLYFTLED